MKVSALKIFNESNCIGIYFSSKNKGTYLAVPHDVILCQQRNNTYDLQYRNSNFSNQYYNSAMDYCHVAL